MDPRLQSALDTDRVIDITTTGRQSGKPRRIEIWFFRVGERLYLTGAPGRARDWFQNLQADARFGFHLKQSVEADFEAIAHPVLEPGPRERILRNIVHQLKPGVPAEWMPGMSEAARAGTEASFMQIARDPEAALPQWLEESPLVEIELSTGPSSPSTD